MKKMEISSRLYIDVMGYPRDIVIVKLGGRTMSSFIEPYQFNLGGGLNGYVE